VSWRGAAAGRRGPQRRRQQRPAFETESGARDWMAYETSDEAIRHQIPGAKIKRFQV
jgi:hypothetical protein